MKKEEIDLKALKLVLMSYKDYITLIVKDQEKHLGIDHVDILDNKIHINIKEKHNG